MRASALWGKRPSGQRSSALWGKGGRGMLAVLALGTALLASSSGAAVAAGSCGTAIKAVVPKALVGDACAHPGKKFNVVVQGRRGQTTADVAKAAQANGAAAKRKFRSIAGLSATISGGRLLALAKDSRILSITPDARVNQTEYQSAEMWRESVRVDQLWSGPISPVTGLEGPAPQAPAIAIVDSGVDPTKVDSFGRRLLASVNLSSLSPLATGDDQGHGTMVAGVAAGADPLVPGVAQNAPIVSIRTSDAHGQSVTSDVIAAADWILANKAKYNIRVANFSLAGASQVSFRVDPLDKAVERLWLSGVTVVAAAGNHGVAGQDVSMSYAPQNDPFVISVGAVDQHETSDQHDDTVAPWSARGYTMDGFAKPDLVAPGRYMIMPVPEASTIATSLPERVLAPGYMWMSGTSFSTPVVSGAAAQILARHPNWGPDQVKGALMLTTTYLGDGAGVGEIDAKAAADLASTPPNPNEHLYDFVVTDSATGTRVFDQASWAKVVESDASWAQASWASASWASASWAKASWAAASWSAASWAADVSSLMTSLASENESSSSE